MKKIILGALGALSLTATVVGVVLLSGFVDVGADSPHSPPVYAAIETVRERSIARHASAISPPADLAAPERIRRGAGNYEAMCAICHLSPGQQISELRQGLYPVPPDLTNGGTPIDPKAAARAFWIIKHGVKGSGMAAWSRAGVEDPAIWDMVALIQRLPHLAPEQYQALVEASEGHSHGSDKNPAAARKETANSKHDHRGHAH